MAKPVREHTKESLYENTEAYDRIYKQDTADIRFYVRQATRQKDAVLDLGCATGRMSLAIAQKGLNVTGLDISPSMLDMARHKSEKDNVNVQWVESDFISFDLKQKFGLIIMSGCTFQDLQNIKQATACLDRVKKHLKENGLFIFDIYNPSLAILSRDSEIRYPVAHYLDASGHPVSVEETSVYDRDTQINHITWYYSRNDAPDYKIDFLKMRQFFPCEMLYILEENGFEVLDRMGDFDGSKFSTHSNRQIFVVRKAKPEVSETNESGFA